MGLLSNYKEKKEQKRREKDTQQFLSKLSEEKKERINKEESSKLVHSHHNADDFYPCYFLYCRSATEDYSGDTCTVMPKYACGPSRYIVSDFLRNDEMKGPDTYEEIQSKSDGEKEVFSFIRHKHGLVYAYYICDAYTNKRPGHGIFGVCFREEDYEKLDVDGFMQDLKAEILEMFSDKQSAFELISKYPVVFDIGQCEGRGYSKYKDREELLRYFTFSRKNGPIKQFDPYSHKVTFDKAIKTKDGKAFIPQGQELEYLRSIANVDEQSLAKAMKENNQKSYDGKEYE